MIFLGIAFGFFMVVGTVFGYAAWHASSSHPSSSPDRRDSHP